MSRFFFISKKIETLFPLNFWKKSKKKVYKSKIACSFKNFPLTPEILKGVSVNC